MADITYSKATNFFDRLIPDALAAAVRASSGIATAFTGVHASGDVVSLVFADVPSAAEQVVLDGIVAAHGLKAAKTQKIAAIDSNTHALIAAGFQYPTSTGQIFSLSDNAQRTLLDADVQRNDLTYPVVWNTKDDTGTFALPNAATLHAFVLTGSTTIRAHLDSGTALKDQVRAATTIAEVDAVTDARL
jgi:hypothetical protein